MLFTTRDRFRCHGKAVLVIACSDFYQNVIRMDFCCYPEMLCDIFSSASFAYLSACLQVEIETLAKIKMLLCLFYLSDDDVMNSLSKHHDYIHSSSAVQVVSLSTRVLTLHCIGNLIFLT